MTLSDLAVGIPTDLPVGVRVYPLVTHRDSRGGFTEIFRGTWDTGVRLEQWNFVTSLAGVLRGVHVHVRHDDYLILLTGRASIGLRDLRRGSPTEGRSALVSMQGDRLVGLTIPPGVAHGFYFHEPSAHVYAMSEYWNPAEEIGCHWSDPALKIRWPARSAITSERDSALPPLSAILDLIPHFRQTDHP